LVFSDPTTGVAHEHRRRIEVVKQEPERRPGGERGQHRRAGHVQAERDDRERDPVDRAQPGGQPVDPVGEVDDVHQRHQPDHRQDAALVGERQQTDPQRQRHVGHHRAALHRDHRRHDLADQLDPRRQVADVVDRADQRDHARAEDHRPRVDDAAVACPAIRVRQDDRVRQPDRRRHQDRQQDRQPAEQRRLVLGQASGPRPIDGPDPARQPGHQRRRDARDRRGDHEREHGIRVSHARKAWQGVPTNGFGPVRRSR
jgi:hypothetical protein